MKAPRTIRLDLSGDFSADELEEFGRRAAEAGSRSLTEHFFDVVLRGDRRSSPEEKSRNGAVIHPPPSLKHS